MPITYTDLQNKVALVTGIGQASVPSDIPNATSIWGNGAATALQLARTGVRVFGCDLNLDAANYTKSRIEAEIPGAQIEVVKADVTQRAETDELARRCVERFEGLDVLVCNVGMSAPGGPVDMSDEVWQKQIDVNLTSTFQTCHSVLPIMEKQKSGSIIVLASVAGIGYAGRMHIGYGTTKAALINFARHVGAHYASSGIRCNAVTPGLIHTPLVVRLAQEYNAGDYEGLVKKRSSVVPMKRMGTAIDVGNAIVWLASDEASGYVTGSEIRVDGGLTAVAHESTS